MDERVTIAELKDAVRDMCLARGWGGEKAIQDPQKMAMAMVCELGEMMEHFAWLDPDQVQELLDGEMPVRRGKIAEELADVMIYAIQVMRALDVDISAVMLDKIETVKRRAWDPDYRRTHPHTQSDQED